MVYWSEMKKLIIIFGALAVVILVWSVLLFTKDKKPSVAEAKSPITLEEIAKHDSKDSCWMVIEGKVYDVTKYIPNHQGGEMILSGCGKDATQMFNSRPNDGIPHSSRARSLLVNYYIGEISK